MGLGDISVTGLWPKCSVKQCENMLLRLLLLLLLLIIIKLNSYLFKCKLNSPEANYKASTIRKKITHTRAINNKSKEIDP
jgi:hypothetical protein